MFPMLASRGFYHFLKKKKAKHQPITLGLFFPTDILKPNEAIIDLEERQTHAFDSIIFRPNSSICSN